MKSRFLFLIFSLLFLSSLSFGKDSTTVFVMKIRAEIDPRMSRYVKLALEQAKKDSADYIIIDMNTYGGAVSDADIITQDIVAMDIPVMVFINANAGSAGSMISISCDSIYMSSASVIGASTVVNQQGKVVDEKYQEFMRSKMRTLAEHSGRDPDIAAGFVGFHLKTDTAKVISFTSTEAVKNGFCEGIHPSIESILSHYNIKNYNRIDYELDSAEEFISIFLNPWLKGILVLVILGGIYFELQTPGVGFPLIAAVVAAILYFIPDYIHGLLANWEILLFFVGVILLALEVFVIPGFGIAGILGAIFVVSSLGLSMLRNDYFDFKYVPWENITAAFAIVIFSFSGTVALIMFGGPALVKTKRFKVLTVNEEMKTEKGYTSSLMDKTLIGKTGTAYTVLRPGGKIKVNNEIYDAHSRGEYIDKEVAIEIIGINSAQYIVKAKA